MNLKKDCLSKLPIEFETVRDFYEETKRARRTDENSRFLIELCLSHERLRAELAGAEELLKTACPHCGPHCDLT